jgi:hypothetical protein
VTTTKLHESEQPPSREAISGNTDDWIRQFITQLESHLLDASPDQALHASVSESQVATARAVLKTFLDSGMELESAVELLGRVAIELRPVEGGWSDGMNQRRFALIDKEIDGTLTPAENIELAGLTGMLRNHVESEANLSVEGARALHRKLLQFESTGESD